MGSVQRVLVVYEPGRAGAAAIDLARGLAEAQDAAVTVVSVAPRARSGSRCGNSALEFNEVVAESVARDLERARERLGETAARATFRLLTDADDEATLEQFAGAGGFDRILLPARRRPLRPAYHPQASRLALIAGAEVQIVEPVSRAREQPPRSSRRGAGAG
jgi:hypothetical protein